MPPFWRSPPSLESEIPELSKALFSASCNAWRPPEKAPRSLTRRSTSMSGVSPPSRLWVTRQLLGNHKDGARGNEFFFRNIREVSFVLDGESSAGGRHVGKGRKFHRPLRNLRG